MSNKVVRSSTWSRIKLKRGYKGMVTFFSEKMWVGGIVKLEETYDKYVLSFEPLYPIYESRVYSIPVPKSMLSRIGNGEIFQCYTDETGGVELYNNELQKSNNANAKLRENLSLKEGEIAMKEIDRQSATFNNDASMLKSFAMMGKAKEAGQLERLVVIDPMTGNLKPIDKSMHQ